MTLQPVGEQGRHLIRQAEQKHSGGPGARTARLGQDRLQLVIGQTGDHRRGHDAHRNARAAEFSDHANARSGRRRARLHLAGQIGVERGDADTHMHEPAGRHVGQYLEIAQHACPTRHYGHRVVMGAQHLKQSAHDAQLGLKRLIGVSAGANGDRRDLIAGLAQLARQHLGGFGAGYKLGLEIEPRRQAQIAMRGAREAVDAAMLAAPVGVDRAVEGHVGAGVARDHAARPLDADLGAHQTFFLDDLPAVMHPFAQVGLEPPHGSTGGAARLQALAWVGRRQIEWQQTHAAKLEHNKNIRQRIRGNRHPSPLPSVGADAEHVAIRKVFRALCPHHKNKTAIRRPRYGR